MGSIFPIHAEDSATSGLNENGFGLKRDRERDRDLDRLESDLERLDIERDRGIYLHIKFTL